MARSAVFRYAAMLWREMKAEFDAHLDAHCRLADHETHGYLVNRSGQAAGVSAVSLFSGSKERALKYASRELLDFWETHPRPSLEDYEYQWVAARIGEAA